MLDTINVSGLILDSNGKPAKNVFISRSFYQCNPNNKIITITNSSGKFYLNGMRFKDTIQIQAINFSKQIINNGSRTLQIILPAVDEVVINNPVRIEAAEVFKKKPARTVKNNDDCGEDYVYYNMSIKAEFPGGDKNLNNYIKNKLVYPELALRNNIEGEVVIQFQISSEGTPNNFMITSGLNKECDEAALKVITEMPKWRPAVLCGRAVTSTHSLAIEFFIKRP